MAFWYVQDFHKDGPVYGAADNWNGLAVIFDTFDNDEMVLYIYCYCRF